MRLLFVCNQGKNRSKTAAEMLSKWHETKSAGIYSNFTENNLRWADKIIVMEDHQRQEIAKRYPEQYLRKQIICLNIPDTYHYNQPELVKHLKSRLASLSVATEQN